MRTELEKALEAQTGMSRWWEESGIGSTYVIRCACGLACEAIAMLEPGGSVGLAELRALSRFRQQYPNCPHMKPYEEFLSAWNLLFIEGQCHERC